MSSVAYAADCSAAFCDIPVALVGAGDKGDRRKQPRYPVTVNLPYDGYLITTVVALVVGSTAWGMIIVRGFDRL